MSLATIKADYLLAGHGKPGFIVGANAVASNFEFVTRKVAAFAGPAADQKTGPAQR